MRKVLLFLFVSLLLVFKTYAAVDNVESDYYRQVHKNFKSDLYENLNKQFYEFPQGSNNIVGEVKDHWHTSYYLPMKDDSLNSGDVAKTYGDAFRSSLNVPSMVTYNEGVNHALKSFCGYIDCTLVNGVTILGDFCENARDERCDPGYFCSHDLDGNKLCIPETLLTEPMGDYPPMSCEDSPDCKEKAYYSYESSITCKGPSEYSEIDTSLSYCIRSYGGSCNAQALTSVASKRPVHGEINCREKVFSREEVEKLLVFSHQWPFWGNLAVVGAYCMTDDLSTYADILGYPEKSNYSHRYNNCNDVSPAALYLALTNFIPFDGRQASVSEKGFAMNTKTMDIWYNYVYGFKMKLLQDNMTFQEAKYCIANYEDEDISNHEACVSPWGNFCNPNTDDSNNNGCDTKMAILMMNSDPDNRYVLVEFNVSLANYTTAPSKFTAILEVDDEGNVVNNSEAIGTQVFLTGGYWVGQSKISQPDQISYPGQRNPAGNYSGVYWEDVEKLYKASIDTVGDYLFCYDPDNDKVCNEPLNVKRACEKPEGYSRLSEVQYPDMVDNCPDNYNPIASYSLKSEFISGEYGAIANQFGRLGFELEFGLSGFKQHYVYKMQPDHDLDGIGDACDYNSASGNGFANSRITNIKPQTPSFMDSPILFDKIYSQYTKINLTMPFGSGRESSYCSDNNLPGLGYRGSTCNAAVHYCAITKEQKDEDLWGTPGFCTVAGDSNSFFQHGLSHGSDNFSYASRKSWESRISVADSSADTKFSNWPEFTGSDNPNDDPARKKVTVGRQVFSFLGSENSTIWNWRRDWYEKSRCFDNPSEDFCQSLKFAGDYNESYTMYYVLSTSILPVTSATAFEDIPDYMDSGNEINPDYFPETNLNINTRAARYSTYLSRPLKLNYYRKQGWTPPPAPETIEIPEIVYCPSCYWNIPVRDFIDEQGLLEASSINHIGRWVLGKDETGNYLMSSQQLYFLEEMMFYCEMNEHEMVAVKAVEFPATGVTEYQLLLNTSHSGASWESLGTINNWDSEITSIKTIVSTDTGLYFIAGTDSQGQYGQYLFRISVDGDVPEITDPENLPEITYSLQNLGLTGIGDDILRDEKLVSIDENLLVIGADSTGAGTRVFKLTNDATLFEEITGSAPVGRKIYNLKVSGKYVFLIGGMDSNNGSINDLWRFDTENEIWEQIPATLQGDFRKVITQVVDGKLVMANPVTYGNTTHPAFEIDPAIEDVSLITVGYIEIPVTEVEYEKLDKYCLNETDFVLKGGLDISGECVPFTHKWYNSFSAGATVYSVAGIGDRLYVGTDGHITVYDISDPAAMTYVTEYSVSGERVYDLEVAENAMYVATSEGIYRFDISVPDTITLINSHYTGYNYQYRIQLYNDLLYVGDDYGINIRDKETLSLISYVDDGAMLDFTISEGKIALYSSAFLSSNIQVRDVDSLNLLAWEYADCYTGELTSDHGEFYLTCDGYDYRFEIGSGTYLDFYSLEADMLELQENYVSNGWVYIPDGSSIKLSTNNDVPSLCGNGIIEPGELCDVNSVACTSIDPNYYGGTAYCNSTCDGYDESSCETDDGW